MANYAGVIKSNTLAESKQKHTPSVRLLITVNRNLDTGEPVDRQFYADLWLGDKAVDKTVKTLREIGWNGMSFNELNDTSALAGIEVEVSTSMEEWNGNQYEKASFVNPKGSYENRGLKSCSDDTARSIAHRYDAVLRGGKVTKSRPNPTGPVAGYGSESEPVDDDLPF